MSSKNPNELPSTPNGKKRCQTCEQVFQHSSKVCPHCKTPYAIHLSFELDVSEDSWGFDNDISKIQSTTSNNESRAELIHATFTRAMETRYKEPARSKELFKEVIAMDPNHYESRLKVSWHEIRFGSTLCIPALLEPVISSPTATLEQKQRAYNNLSCACLVGRVVDAAGAEKWALAGLRLDGKGTPKLWENLGGAYREQGRLHQALEAFTKSLLIDPSSKHVQKSIKLVEKDIKNQKAGKKEREKDKVLEKPKEKVKVKKDKKQIQKYDLQTENKENVPQNVIQRSTSYASFFKRQKSDKSIKVVHC